MIQSIERASEILHLFEKQSSWGITQIAKQLQLNKSTAFGIVATLEQLKFLEKDSDTGRYHLGLALYRLGNLVDADLRRMILPELTELSNILEETVNFVRPEGADVVYLLKKESPYSMRICTKIGQRFPMYVTAVGKSILAFLPEAQRQQLLSQMNFKPYTEHTLLQPEQLERELMQIRAQGYALDLEEMEIGLICVAVPILDAKGFSVAALSCSGPKMRMTESRIAQCTELLLQSAARISEIMRYIR
ncbi:MAG: IclR family transcriptional regulator [Clostridiales bacterium]|nr:IclR family transcriptional regulator [Clostridiales bacterium]